MKKILIVIMLGAVILLSINLDNGISTSAKKDDLPTAHSLSHTI